MSIEAKSKLIEYFTNTNVQPDFCPPVSISEKYKNPAFDVESFVSGSCNFRLVRLWLKLGVNASINLQVWVKYLIGFLIGDNNLRSIIKQFPRNSMRNSMCFVYRKLTIFSQPGANLITTKIIANLFTPTLDKYLLPGMRVEKRQFQ